MIYRYRYPLYSKRSSHIPPQHDYRPYASTNEPGYNLYDDYSEDGSPLEPPQAIGFRGLPLDRDVDSNHANEVFMEQPISSQVLNILDSEAGEGRPEPGAKTDVMNDFRNSVENDDELNHEEAELIRHYIAELNRRKIEESFREEQLKMEEAELLKELMSRAEENPYRESEELSDSSTPRVHAMIRRKRNAVVTTTLPPATKAPSNVSQEETKHRKIKIPARVAVAEFTAELAMDRKKRAFNNLHEDSKRKRNYDQNNMKRQENEELDDFLTREYFKTIARSVGNKKKRMVYGKFETKKTGFFHR